MTTRTSIIIGLLLAVAALGQAAAAPPRLQEAGDSLLLSNTYVTIEFEGKRPVLHVHGAAAGDAGFSYTFERLVEYRDVDGNGIADANEIVASLDLANATTWNFTSAASDDALVLTLMLSAPVKVGDGRAALPETPALPIPNGTLPDAMANVSLVFTLHDAATIVDAAGINTTIPASSVTYDLVVETWPFVNANLDRLALQTSLTGDVEIDNSTGFEGGDVVQNGTKLGALAWTTIAEGNTTQGAPTQVPVHVVSAPADNATLLTTTYDTADLATLIHTATLGANPTPAALESSADGAVGTIRDVPNGGVALVALGAVAAALVAARRRG